MWRSIGHSWLSRECVYFIFTHPARTVFKYILGWSRIVRFDDSASSAMGIAVHRVRAILFRSPKNHLRNSRFDPMKTDVMVPESKSDLDLSWSLGINLRRDDFLVLAPVVVPPSDTFNPATDSLHAAIRPIIVLAQCFSMLPVCGVNKPDASHLRYARTVCLISFRVQFAPALSFNFPLLGRSSHGASRIVPQIYMARPENLVRGDRFPGGVDHVGRQRPAFAHHRD